MGKRNTNQAPKSPERRGRVTLTTGAHYELLLDSGETVHARARGRLRLDALSLTNPIAVGDEVCVSLEPSGDAVISSILERKNVLIRQSTHRTHEAQILAANIDLAAVMVSFRQPKYKYGFIDRFLVACEAYGVPACVVIHKCDLAQTDEDVLELKALAELYRQIGYSVYTTSVNDARSLTDFESALVNKTTVISGQSGVGKSSVINHISPEFRRKTAEISTFNEKGRHTTTFAEMLRLPGGGYIIDTPGLRELGLFGIEPHEISYYFPEMAAVKSTCSLRHCLCLDEPSCPVQHAFSSGKIAASRFESYINMVESLLEQKN